MLIEYMYWHRGRIIIMDSSKEMVKIAYSALDDKMGEDIRILDISNISVLADYFIIAHGNNSNHVRALIDFTEEKLNKAGYETKNIEGTHNGSWVLMDFKDIIVHVFDKDSRVFYDLERVWSEGKVIEDINNL